MARAEAAKAKRRGQRRDHAHGKSDEAHGKGEKGKQRGGVDEEDAEGEDADADITAAPTPAIPATPAEVDLEKGGGGKKVGEIETVYVDALEYPIGGGVASRGAVGTTDTKMVNRV